MCKVLAPEKGQRWVRSSNKKQYDIVLVVKDFFTQGNYVVVEDVQTEERVGFMEDEFLGVAFQGKMRFTLLSSTCLDCSKCPTKEGGTGE